MLPAMGSLGLGAGTDAETQRNFRRFNTMMDSMTDSELDERDPRKLFREAKIRRVALGSGAHLVRASLHHFQLCACGPWDRGQARDSRAAAAGDRRPPCRLRVAGVSGLGVRGEGSLCETPVATRARSKKSLRCSTNSG